MTTIIPSATGTELPLKGLRISAKELRALTSKALADQSSAEGDGLIALTRYNNVYAYVVPVEMAEKVFKFKSSQDFLDDFKAAVPYIKTAIAGGVDVEKAIEEVFNSNIDGEITLNFAGLARLITEIPIRFDLNEDGSPITRTNFKEFSTVVEAEDEDYSQFDRL